MRNMGNVILIIGALLFIASGVLVFITDVDRNIVGTLLVIGLILSGAGSSIKKKK